MDGRLLQRLKQSLNKQHYTMNSSWLNDCVEFYMNDHQNPTEEEIAAFVMNQWTLYDLREINNENGCLPKNLASQKCTTLPGKYILQVDKMYDIATSKYKQLEKIRNVSSENIEATENENKVQEDKFQTWEPKSKRMLQFFLTDGSQDILGIEYKTIRFLKECKEPGFKLMIKGPVICRKGVLLLEENNIVEIGGEVDNLLITNALENVLARALNLEENPDPYNDKTKSKQNIESTQKNIQVDDDFDIDSEMLDQIDKQIQNPNANASKNSASSNWSNKQTNTSKLSELNYSYQAPSTSHQTQKTNTSNVRSQVFNSGSTLNNQRSNKIQKSGTHEKMDIDFDDEGDSFLEMVDDSAFKTPYVSKTSTIQSKSVTTKQMLTTKSGADEFPDDDEIYDLTDSHSAFFPSSKSKPQPITTKINSRNKGSSSITTSSPKNNQKHTNVERETGSSRRNLKESSSVTSSYKNTSKIPSQNKNNVLATPSVSEIDHFVDNLDLGDMDFDAFDDYFDTNTKDSLKTPKHTQLSTSSSSETKSKTAIRQDSPFKFSTNSAQSSDENFHENDFVGDFYERCRQKLITSPKSSQHTTKNIHQKKSKNEEAVSRVTSSQVTKPSTSKLSDKLNFDNKSKEYYNINNKVEEKSFNTARTENSAYQTNRSSSTTTKIEKHEPYDNLDAVFGSDFDVEFEARMEVDTKPIFQQPVKNTLSSNKDKNAGYSTTKSNNPIDNKSDTKSTSSKRPASLLSPCTTSRQKLRCVESTPKDKSSSRKITDFFERPQPKLIDCPVPLYEAICDVLENSRKKDQIRTMVRGKVINVVKLSLEKGEGGYFFHLDGTITDGTANLDVTFSSELLEEIIGYSTHEFTLKRKRAKTDPKIKDELRDDLKKAQNILRVMDALMEIEVKKDEKTIIIGAKPLSKEDKKRADERLQRYKAEKR